MVSLRKWKLRCNTDWLFVWKADFEGIGFWNSEAVTRNCFMKICSYVSLFYKKEQME